MITIWCPRRSVSAKLLVNEINQMGGRAILYVHGLPDPPLDYLMDPDAANAKIYWGQGGGDKYAELERLADAGIPVPAHSRLPHPGWLARTARHREARDLLREITKGDYYVEYVPTLREHRVHVVEGKVICVQGKIPRRPTPHPRYRSWRSGWKLVATPATTATLPPKARTCAKAAVAALHYHFGAVDVGTQADGSPIVFEVNSQPGLEGGTIRRYARAFITSYGG